MEYRVQEFLAVCAEDGHTLIASDFFLRQVSDKTMLSKDEILGYLKGLGVKVEQIVATREMIRRNLSRLSGIKTDPEDKIHMALALESRCDMIVTWNIKDYKPAEKVIKSIKPSDFT